MNAVLLIKSVNNTLLAKILNITGHILDLYCVQLLNTTPFSKILKSFILMQNTYKRAWTGGRDEIFGAIFIKKVSFFHKKVPFLANMEHCPKFLEYALYNKLNAIRPKLKILCIQHKFSRDRDIRTKYLFRQNKYFFISEKSAVNKTFLLF